VMSYRYEEPDREPAPGEHRPYDPDCDCDECSRERELRPHVYRTFYYPAGLPGYPVFAAWMTMWWEVGQFHACRSTR
jgi:hypothetical protein